MNSFTEKSLNINDYDVLASGQNSKRPFSVSDVDFIECESSVHFETDVSFVKNKNKSISSIEDFDYQVNHKNNAELNNTKSKSSNYSIKILKCKNNKKNLSTLSIKLLSGDLNNYKNLTGILPKQQNKKHRATTSFEQLHNCNIENKTCDYAIIESSQKS